MFEKSGHEILALKYVKKEKGYYYISTYDPNYPNKKTYLKISTNYKKVKVTNYKDFKALDSISNFDCFNKYIIK